VFGDVVFARGRMRAARMELLIACGWLHGVSPHACISSSTHAPMQEKRMPHANTSHAGRRHAGSSSANPHLRQAAERVDLLQPRGQVQQRERGRPAHARRVDRVDRAAADLHAVAQLVPARGAHGERGGRAGSAGAGFSAQVSRLSS